MAGHTPGPWTNHAGRLIADNHGRIVATATARRKLGQTGAEQWEVTSIEPTEADTNAYLLAAAPDLLAAVKNLLPHAARLIQGTTDGAPILEQARNAIRKAERS